MLKFLRKKAICTCHIFEFVGILCSHILTVFVKKSLVDFLPPLERWKIKAKNHIIHDISSDVIQVEPQISSTLMRNSLRLHFLEVAEVGSQSIKKYEHLDLALQKVHVKLLAMHNVDDFVSTDNTILNSKYYQNFQVPYKTLHMFYLRGTSLLADIACTY